MTPNLSPESGYLGAAVLVCICILVYLAIRIVRSTLQFRKNRREFPKPCSLCGRTIFAAEEEPYHGIQWCVEQCSRCNGSGQVTKAVYR